MLNKEFIPYKVSDFKVGDLVFHRTNLNFKLLVVSIFPDYSLVCCKWISPFGVLISADFKSFELRFVSRKKNQKNQLKKFLNEINLSFDEWLFNCKIEKVDYLMFPN